MGSLITADASVSAVEASCWNHDTSPRTISLDAGHRLQSCQGVPSNSHRSSVEQGASPRCWADRDRGEPTTHPKKLCTGWGSKCQGKPDQRSRHRPQSATCRSKPDDSLGPTHQCLATLSDHGVPATQGMTGSHLHQSATRVQQFRVSA